MPEGMLPGTAFGPGRGSYVAFFRDGRVCWTWGLPHEALAPGDSLIEVLGTDRAAAWARIDELVEAHAAATEVHES